MELIGVSQLRSRSQSADCQHQSMSPCMLLEERNGSDIISSRIIDGIRFFGFLRLWSSNESKIQDSTYNCSSVGFKQRLVISRGQTVRSVASKFVCADSPNLPWFSNISESRINYERRAVAAATVRTARIVWDMNLLGASPETVAKWDGFDWFLDGYRHPTKQVNDSTERNLVEVNPRPFSIKARDAILRRFLGDSWEIRFKLGYAVLFNDNCVWWQSLAVATVTSADKTVEWLMAVELSIRFGFHKGHRRVATLNLPLPSLLLLLLILLLFLLLLLLLDLAARPASLGIPKNRSGRGKQSAHLLEDTLKWIDYERVFNAAVDG